jgi:hypothetical protein
MANKLVCWQCGASLKEVPLPISRLAECPRCRADLHACRLCKHYDPRLIGECRHDRADRVLDKTHANFCTHFRPRPDAYLPDTNNEAQRARSELEALFGMEGAAPDPADSADPADPADPADAADAADAAAPEDRRSEAERAREALDALFGGDRKKDE